MAPAESVLANATGAGPVRGLRVTGYTTTSVSLAWSAPAVTGGTISSYKVSYRATGGSWVDVTPAPTATSVTVGSLTRGTGYSFRVQAVTGAGSGTAGLPAFVGVNNVALGHGFACAVMADGTVTCVGQNSVGQLGTGTTFEWSSTPVTVSGIGGVGGVKATAVTAGEQHACALLTTGAVRCWGENDVGQLGDGTRTTRTSPVAIAGGGVFSSIAAGAFHTCGVRTDGAFAGIVRCWGAGEQGQMGNGTLPTTGQPTQGGVLNLTGANAVFAGSNSTCARTSAGAVSCWGDNSNGQFAVATPVAATTPIVVAGAANAVDVSLGMSQMCAMGATGSVRCWGTIFGERTERDLTLGAAGTVLRADAVGQDSGVTTSCAVTATGERWCFSEVTAGVLGVAKDDTVGIVASIFEGDGERCDIGVEGVTRCSLNAGDLFAPAGWGAAEVIPASVPDAPENLAAPTATPSTVTLTWNAPTQNGGRAVTDYTLEWSLDGSTWTTVTDGVSTNLTATVTGLTRNTSYTFRVRAVNAEGAGAGATVVRTTARVTGAASVPGPPREVRATATSSAVTLVWVAPAFDGGSDVTGYVVEYLDGTWKEATTTTGSATSVTIGVGSGLVPGGKPLRYRVSAVNGQGRGAAAVYGATAVAGGGFFTCARMTDATVQCWGENSTGQLGAGTNALKSATPLQVSGLSNVVSVSAGETHTCVVVNASGTGQLRCWGENLLGQLGDGTQTPRYRPTTVPGLTVPLSAGGVWDNDVVAAGGGHTCAVIVGGEVRCWGDNYEGQLGTGTTNENPVPTPQTVVWNGSTMTGAVAVATGAVHSCALMTGGTVRCWGANDLGQLNVPAGLANVVRLSARGDRTCALRGDGGLSCWGGDDPVPDAIALVSDATAVSVGTDHLCVVSGAGLLRCWNDPSLLSDTGEIVPENGDPAGSTLTLPTVSAVGAGGAHTCAIAVDGSMQCWGDNSYDQLGTSSTSAGGGGVIVTVPGVGAREVNLVGQPGAPTGLRVTGVNGTSVSIAWDAPLSDGGATISDYEIQRQVNGAWVDVDAGVISTATSLVLTGLTLGVDFPVQVRAVNTYGGGLWSTPLTVRAYSAPGAPPNLALVSTGDGTATLSWGAPASNGSPVTRYEVVMTPAAGSGGAASGCSTTTTGCTVSGLTNGVTYSASVRARNEAGLGTAATLANVLPRTVPGAVRSLSSVGGDARVTLTWDAPTSDGGAAISSWETSLDGRTWSAVTPSVSSGGSAVVYTLVVTGLVNGTPYTYRVRAVNAVGAGASVTAASVTPMVVDGAPQNVQAVPGDGAVTLNWSPGTWGGGGLVRYEARWWVTSAGSGGADAATWTSAGTATTLAVSGLTNGTGYSFEVRAVSAAGNGAISSAVSTSPRRVPGAALMQAPSSGDGFVLLSWEVPASDGGSAIVRYEVRTDAGPWVSVGNVTSTRMTGLANGTSYAFVVRAVNAAGAGTESASVSATPRTSAGAPEIVAVIAGVSAVTVKWTAPASLGGGVLEGYKVSVNGGAFTSVSHTTAVESGVSVNTATVSTLLPATGAGDGLANGVTYSFRVLAVTQSGDGLASAAATATPRTVPGAPGGVSATPDNKLVTLYWSAPTFDGGSPLLRYEVWNPASGAAGAWESAGLATSYSVSGLTNGVSYALRVRAVNVAGEGAASSDVTATPLSVAGVPGLQTPTAGVSSVVLAWTAPEDTGGSAVVRYEYQRRTTPVNLVDGTWDGATWVSMGLVERFTVTGLTNGVSYDFRIRVVTGFGAGAATDAKSATPRSFPTAPALVGATGGERAVTVQWRPPTSDGGLPVTKYQVRVGTAGGFEDLSGVTVVSGSGATAVLQATVTQYNGLTFTGGLTYVLRVRAVNAAGASATSGSVSATPRDVPGAPVNVSVVNGDASATIAWGAGPGFGSATTRYEYTTDDGATVGVLSASVGGAPPALSATVSVSSGGAALVNGASYEMRVRAVTDMFGVDKAGAWSSAVALKPRTTPAKPTLATPTNVLGLGGPAIGLSWTPGASLGSTVLKYQYTTDGGATWRDLSAGSVSTLADTVTVRSSGSALVYGVTYPVSVRAVTDAGNGAASDAMSAVAFTVPGAPVLVAVAGDGAVELNVDVPDTGGTAVTGFRYRVASVVSTEDGEAVVYGEWVVVASAVMPATFTVPDLMNGTSYWFVAEAFNPAGGGATSEVASATPRTTPDAPSDVTVSEGDGSLTLSWSAPTGDGGAAVLGYQYQVNDGAWTDVADGSGGAGSAGGADGAGGAGGAGGAAADARSVTVSGRTNGTTYALRVRAVNVAGAGDASEVVNGTPRTVPDAPMVTSAVPGDGQVQVRWLPHGDGGAPIESYEWRTTADNVTSGWTSAGAETSATVTGLANGATVTFEVRAVNVAGAGSAAATTLVPRTAPSAPSDVSAVRGDQVLVLSWSAPADNGAPIVRYEYALGESSEYVPAGTATAVTVTGLANGSAYLVRVRAVNAAGPGLAGSVVETPGRAPGAPSVAVTSAASGAVSLEWSVGDDGGLEVSEYRYQVDGAGDWTSTGAGAGATVSGLVNGRAYSFRVQARNAEGWGAISTAVSATPLASPGAPVLEQVKPGNGSAIVSWSAPADTGGDAVSEYRVGVNGVYGEALAASATGTTLTGLANGESYTITVKAGNSVGLGDASEAVDVTPRTVPDAPVVSVSGRGDGFVSVEWEPGDDGGAEVLYFEYRVAAGVGAGSGSAWVLAGAGAARSVTVHGLDNGVSASVSVRAVNVAGEGAASESVSATPYTVPDAPVVTAATGADGVVVLSWTAPDFDGGEPISEYEWSSDGGATWTSAGLETSVSVAGLVNGQPYAFRVRAVNLAGTGSASAVTTGTPVGPPAAPVLSAEGVDEMATLTWNEPDDGGSDVLGYTVERLSGQTWVAVVGGTVPFTLRRYSVTGLDNGTEYTFRVRAVNGAGAGAWSEEVAVTPAGPPSVPLDVRAVRGTRQLIVNWDAPSNTSGREVLGYRWKLSIDGDSAWTTTSEGPVTVTQRADGTALSNGTGYTVQVRAVTDLGAGAIATVTASTLRTPNAPTALVTSADLGTVSVSWTAATVPDGEDPIRSYMVTATAQGASGAADTCIAEPAKRGDAVPTTCTVDGLVLGRSYVVAVVARNTVGDSAPASRTVVPMDVPGSPRNVLGTPGNGQIVLAWAAPAFDGGAAVTRYEWRRDGGAWVGAGLATSVTVGGLANGTEYEFEVRAVNAAGAGEVSDPVYVAPVMPPPVLGAAFVRGAMVQGRTVSCDTATGATIDATWTMTWSWSRNGVSVAGSTRRTYVLGKSDVGRRISCVMTATNEGGSTSATSAASATVMGTSKAVRATKKPTVSPTTKVKAGARLTCAKGTWSGGATSFVYRWVRTGGAGGSATVAQGSSNRYTVGARDAGGRLSCEVTGVNSRAKTAGVAVSTAVSVGR